MATKARLEELFLLAEEVNRYGSLDKRLPEALVKKVRAKKAQTSLGSKRAKSEHTTREQMLSFSYGL